jgi:hypothetical protein
MGEQRRPRPEELWHGGALARENAARPHRLVVGIDGDDGVGLAVEVNGDAPAR